MLRKILLLICFVLMANWMLAQITIQLSPPSIFVNRLNTGSFDPVNPLNQPILTHVTFTNIGTESTKYNVQVIINWNELQVVNVNFNSISHLLPGNSVIYTNRDLITNSASAAFEAPDGDMDITTIMNRSPVLRDALQAGYFPDGSLKFKIVTTPFNKQNLKEDATFVITIKNINAIFLTYPGRSIGLTPPEIDLTPVSFLWNTINTPSNTFKLKIKEFVPGIPPTINSVNTGGRVISNEDVTNNIFTEFVPFKNKHYYAWQVSTGLINETNFNNTNIVNPLVSDWYVFRYIAERGQSSNSSQQMQIILNMLNDPQIQNLLALGFELTGMVIFEGRVYTGQEALDLINSLIGKDLEIEVKDQ